MRADLLLQRLGYARSRESAKKLIELGLVIIDGVKVTKPSRELDDSFEHDIVITEKPRYVSRGGYKLEGILNESGIDPSGKVCIDIGSSTGGFTDCLLQHGAAHVYCVDSGSNQLDDSLRQDSRTTVLEKTNARMLSKADIPVLADIIVMDVSFISQTLIHESVSSLIKDDGVFISLIKPQFELSRAEIGKGGIVKHASDRRKAARRVVCSLASFGLYPEIIIDSKITGGDGNREYTAVFTRTKNDTDIESKIKQLT